MSETGRGLSPVDAWHQAHCLDGPCRCPDPAVFEGRVPTPAEVYGSAEHAATEALRAMRYGVDGNWLTCEVTDAAEAVVAGLRERGFMVSREPRCECGWTGESNHYHAKRMGRTDG